MNKLSLVCLCMFLVSCSTSNVTPSGVPIRLSTSASMITATAIPSTPIFTPTRTPIYLPSWTPLPTLVDQDSFLDFISFTKDSICRLPCWANIVPGQTTWHEAIFALHPIETVANLEIMPDQESSYGRVNTLSWYLYGGDFRTEGKFLTGNNANLIRLSFESFAESSHSHSVPLPKRFNLQSVLNEYGIPSMVFIYTFIHDEPGPLPFSILLIYPENHFYIIYQRDASLRGNNVTACGPEFHLELAIIDNKEKLVSADAISNSPETKAIGIVNWKPVEQVLSISPQKFHDIYTASMTECMSFPRNLWKP